MNPLPPLADLPRRGADRARQVADVLRRQVLSGQYDEAPLWALGALRRGEPWESTAVPEIRVQAAAVAADVLTALTAPAQVVA